MSYSSALGSRQVTLGRLSGARSCALIDEPFATRFPVHEVALVRSERDSGGAHYETIGRFSAA